MKKKILSLLLVLIMVLGMFPMSAMAAEGETAGTLQFSTDVQSDPYYLTTTTSWGGPSVSLTVAVGTYTPDGGEPTALPAGTSVKYQWYKSADNVADAADTKIGGATQATYSVSSRNAAVGTDYYYAVATATVEGETYTGTSSIASVKVGAANINITLSVNNKGVIAKDKNDTAVNAKSVSVLDANYDGKHTYDEALLAAHTALLTVGDYATAESEYGLQVTKLWGVETTNTAYYKNGAKLETGVGEDLVKGGDKLYVSINKDDTYYSDKYVAFDQTAISTTAGLETELTLTDEEGNALAGITVGLWKDGAFEALEGKTTDENGKVKVSFEESGTYVVTATGTIKGTVTDYSNWPETTEVPDFDCPIMAPGCTFTVKKAGELKFDGQFASSAYEVKVGEKFAYPYIYARYYIDGTIDYSVAATTTWYRIGAGSNGQPEKVTNINALMTAADVGTWQYYQYAECTAYGVKYTAMTNMATVIIGEPSAIPGDASNNFVSDFTYQAGYTNNVDVGYEAGKSDYTIIHYDNGANDTIKGVPVFGKGLWFGYRVNGIKDSASYNGADKEINLTMQNAIAVTLPTTFKAGGTDVVTILVGTKKDTSGNGRIEADEAFDVYDAYNFTVKTLPSFSSLTVKDSAGTNIALDQNVNSYGAYWASDLYATTDSETVKLSAQFKAADGVKLYIGDSEEAYTANLTDVELTLADYEGGNIPLKLVAEREDGSKAEHTVTLHFAPATGESAATAPTIKTQPAAESTVDKGESVTLTVEAETPAEGELSYQWFWGSNSLSYVNRGAIAIEGATSATFEAPAGEVAGELFYWCRVGLTVNGNTAYTVSDTAKITTKLTWVTPPKFTIQPGLGADKAGAGIYNTEYTAGGKFDTLWVGIDCNNVNIGGGKYVWITEAGCEPPTLTAYYNSTPTLEGATAVTGTMNDSYSGGTFKRFVGFTPDTGLPEGEWYVCVVIKSVAKDDPTKSASTASDFIKMTFAPADLGLDGKGSAEDPYLLKTGADFVTLQQQVAAGNTLGGITFKMANDITLPENWEPMGSNGSSGFFFGGIIDGGGYTLTYPKGSKSLIHHAKNAEIKNLKIYGEEIQEPALIASSWINQTMGAYIAKIDNITILSGTSTLKSGLVSGSASTYNPIYISNCVAEEGVIIGYDKQQSNIGTFAGGFVGSITNCRSAATIYGVSSIGGIYSGNSNSMGAGKLTNLVFTGKIVATGSNIGGIIGAGYNSNSAPNGMLVNIQNCYVNAEITGKQNVGGLLGADAGVQQGWDNGIGYIRNNVFYGTLTGEKNVGGMVGYYAALNKYNIIENNYFYDTNGHTNAIGGVEHIDTSAREFGMNDDGIFYYDTSKDSLDDIKDFVDAEDKGTADWQYTSVAKTNHNRTDDPMGVDKEKLGKLVTAEAMKDGTILALLNGTDYSTKNWIQGDEHPVLDNTAYITELKLGGTYKIEYYIGDSFDTTGMVFTAVWSDNHTTSVPAADVTFTGFDSSERAALVLTATYSGVSTQFTVEIVKRPTSTEDINSITVYFTILGDDIHYDEDGNNTTGETHTLKSGNLDTWIARKAYKVDMNATVWDVLQKVLAENGMTCDYTMSLNTVYVKSVTRDGVTIGEFDNGPNSGWQYTLNGTHPLLGVAQQYLENGDEIVFHYTDDYTVEEGSEPWYPDAGGNDGKPNEKPTAGEITVPISGDENTIHVGATVEGTKATIDEVDLTDLNKVVGDQVDTGTVTIDFSGLESDEAITTVELPADTVKKIAEAVNDSKNDAHSLEIVLSDGASIEFDAAALKEKASQANGADITISIESHENVKLTNAQKKALGDRPAFDINVTSGGKHISDMGGKITVHAPYVLKGNEKARGIVVYYVDDNGNRERCETSYDPIKKRVNWKTDHLSLYMIDYDETLANNPFDDVAQDAYYFDAVLWAVDEGITKGTSDTTFSPDASCTRAQMVTFLWRAAGSPKASVSTCAFTDVDKDAYYYEALLWAVENGITSGTSATTFSPNASCTRGQMATFLYRDAKSPAVTGTHAFTDVKADAYYNNAVIWAAAEGITVGTSDTTFSPDAGCTRGQMVTFLYRYLAK